MIWSLWFLLVLIAVIAIPLLIEHDRRVMDDAERGKAPGKFATLPLGVTHYSWYGPADGPVLICIHGLTTPSFVWRGLIKGFAAMGFRVLIYDLYGRGYSDRPAGKQDSAFFLRQLADLLTHQEVTGKVSVIGYSMGGAIATAFAATHPERVRQLILLAPAGMKHAVGRQTNFIREWRVVGDWLMLAFFPRNHRKGINAERHLASSVLRVYDLQEYELEFKRFIHAVLASLRGILANDQQSEHQVIADEALPVIAIWGQEDNVIPLSAVGALAEWNRDVEHEVIEGAGHGLTYTHSQKILDFLEPRMIR